MLGDLEMKILAELLEGNRVITDLNLRGNLEGSEFGAEASVDVLRPGTGKPLKVALVFSRRS